MLAFPFVLLSFWNLCKYNLHIKAIFFWNANLIIIIFVFIWFVVFRNAQGHLIDMGETLHTNKRDKEKNVKIFVLNLSAPMNKPGRFNIRIDGYSFGKWTSSKSIVYWRCSRAQAIKFVFWKFTKSRSKCDSYICKLQMPGSCSIQYNGEHAKYFCDLSLP